MDFDVKSWGWVGDIYHKVESMIQEVDDIMKEEANNVGQNTEESSEDKKNLSTVEVHAAPQQAKEIHSPPTDGKKPEEEQEAFEPAVNGIAVKRDESEEEQKAFEPPVNDITLERDRTEAEQEAFEPPVTGIAVKHDESEEEQKAFEPPVNDIALERDQTEAEQEAFEPPVNGNTVECDQSEEERAQTTCNCKSTSKCGDEASRVITRYSKIAQSLMDNPKAREFDPVTQVAGSVSSDSSMSLGSPSDIGEIERPTVSGIARDMQDDELKDSGSSNASLVDLVKDSSVESPGAHFDGILTDNNDDAEDSGSSIASPVDLVNDLSVESPGFHFDSSLTDNNDIASDVKESVLESSKCQDELYEIFINVGAVGGNNIDERAEVVTNTLSASPMHVHLSHLHQEIGETCANVEISGDSVTFSTNASSFNDSLVSITAKLMERMELEALTNDLSEKRSIDGSKLSHSPLSGTAVSRIGEPLPLENPLEEAEKRSQDSGTSGENSMETIDLDDEEDLQESCASIDMRDLLVVSQRVKRFKSFKRKILDAFASRRRTAKEYEQLGIMQGDVNFECGGRHVMRNNTAPFPDNRSRIEHADDTDWELL